MLFFSRKSKLTIILCISFLFLLFSKNGICRTPGELDRVIDDFEHSKTPDDQLKLAYLGLDLYAPIPQKSDVDPGDRITLSQMKRMVLTNAMDRAGKDILITAVGTTGYWVLDRTDRIVNNYPADDQDRIVQLKRNGCYMEGLSDLDFVIMGPNAAVYRDNLYRIFAEGNGNVHLVPDEMEELEISFITDDQIKDLAPGPKGRKFWDQLMNLEESSPHPEKYITKGGKALYGMEHLYEEGAVALSNRSEIPELFNEYANKAGHHMGPFTIVHLFGGSCDMDYFLAHALEKSNQESVKTILQVMKYLKREEWMLRRTAKNINRLPPELPEREDTVKSLENYADKIASFTDKAIEQKVWKSPQATIQFGKEAEALSGVVCSFAHECLINTGDVLLELRENKQLTDETRSLLSSIVFDLVTVDEDRYPHGYPSWYATAGSSQGRMPRDKTLDFLKRYREGETDHKTDGPVIALPEVRKKKKMDTGPILPPPAAYIEIDKVDVSPQKPLAGAPVTFTVSGYVHGISDRLPDFTKNEFSDDQQKKMEQLGLWSLRATIYRMQIQYLMEQDQLSKRTPKLSDKIYVSPYEIKRIAEDYLEPAEDEIARLSKELDLTVSDEKSGKYAFRVRPVPSVQSIKDYLKALDDTCGVAKKALDIFYNFAFSLHASINLMYEEDTSIIVTEMNYDEEQWTEEIAAQQFRNKRKDVKKYGNNYSNKNTNKNIKNTADSDSKTGIKSINKKDRDSYNNIKDKNKYRVKNNEPQSRTNILSRLAQICDNSSEDINYLDETIEFAEQIKKRVEQMENLLNADPSAAAEIAGDIQKHLDSLAKKTLQAALDIEESNTELVSVLSISHKLMEKIRYSKNNKKNFDKALSIIEDFEKKQKELNKKTIPELMERSIWLNRGAWAAWGARWGFEALTLYSKYQEEKDKLNYTDLSAGSENAILSLVMVGNAIEKLTELIPIPVLDSTIKSYSKLFSDATKMAIYIDSLQAQRYQDEGFDVRMAVLPAAYQSLMDNNPELKPDLFYRTRMPLAEYNKLTILAYPTPEPTETGPKPRDRMWLIWDKHLPDGYLLLDKNTYENMSIYAAWYRRVYEKDISGTVIHDLLTNGEIKDGYIFKETITPDILRKKAADILRLKALEAYFFSLAGKLKFKDEELFTYMSMLHYTAGEYAKSGFLLTDPDVKEIMEAVFYEKPIQGNWKTAFDIFSMSYGTADRLNDSAAAWDKLSGGEKDRLDNFLKKFIQKKVDQRAKEREKNWKEARIREDSENPVAAGLLYPETGLVFNHAFFSKAGDTYADDYIDISSPDFTITWKTVMPDDTKNRSGTYVCTAEIAGYPDTLVQFALRMDTLENDILKQMLELAEKAEKIGETAWSTCQSATARMIAFEERKEDFIRLLEELKNINQAFDSVQLQAIQAPDLLKRNSFEAIRLSDEILKDLTEIEKLKTEICEISGTTDPGEKQNQIRLFQQMKQLMENVKIKSRRFEELFNESDKALTAWNKFEKMIEEYKSLLTEKSGWARELCDGFADSLKDLTKVEEYIKELTELKNKADDLLAEANKVYSDPDSESVLQEIKEAHARVERPLNEVTDCCNLAIEKKGDNLPTWYNINPELTRAESNFESANEKWKSLESKKEEVNTFSKEITDLWQKVQTEILKAENYISEAEGCMGNETSADSENRVPDLTGMTMSAAKNAVTTAGFKPVFRGGNAAPSRKQSFTVASQSPEAGETQQTGSPVTIILYGNFAGNLVPDVTGLSSKEAKEKLEKSGFTAALEGGDPAPDVDKRFKVQSQVPGAGEKAEQGSSVKVRIYGDVHNVLVPSIVNMTSSQAKSTVSSVGLVPSLFGGDPAPKKSMSYRVQSQSPAPGTRVLHGSSVSIHVYGKFDELTALANADCSHFPGTILKWDDKNDRAACYCPSGTVWNQANNTCVRDTRKEDTTRFLIGLATTIIANEIVSGNNTGGNTTSGGNTYKPPPTSTASRPPTGATTVASSGSQPMSRDECERKFCPECTNSVSLLGQSVSPQCMDCRKRKQNDIEKCMRGEKTGPGTQHVAKEYKVICYLNDINACISYDVVKISAPINGRYQTVYRGPDTWDKCHMEAERLRENMLRSNPLIRY